MSHLFFFPGQNEPNWAGGVWNWLSDTFLEDDYLDEGCWQDTTSLSEEINETRFGNLWESLGPTTCIDSKG